MSPSPTATPARVAAVTPLSDIEARATPPTLLRDRPKNAGPNIPVVVLGVVGVVALLGGLLGLAIILLSMGRGAR